jgi:hypothetical protein
MHTTIGRDRDCWILARDPTVERSLTSRPDTPPVDCPSTSALPRGDQAVLTSQPLRAVSCGGRVPSSGRFVTVILAAPRSHRVALRVLSSLELLLGERTDSGDPVAVALGNVPERTGRVGFHLPPLGRSDARGVLEIGCRRSVARDALRSAPRPDRRSVGSRGRARCREGR